MIIRNDILPSTVTIPKALLDTIERTGGKTPFHEPMFRLLLAECRVVKAAGAWNQWREGLPVEDRGGLGIKQIQRMIKEGRSTDEINEYVNARVTVQPEKTVIGMIDRPLYQFKGFILEKWKPAITFGSPDEWYAYRFQGEAALGPYPTYGDYELCAGPTPYMPTQEQCIEAIQRTFREIDERPTSPQARMSQMLLAQEEQEKALDRETHSKIEEKFKEDALLYKTSSLAAGRARNELAEAAGIKEHYGN
jgi:hypothetical protein